MKQIKKTIKEALGKSYLDEKDGVLYALDQDKKVIAINFTYPENSPIVINANTLDYGEGSGLDFETENNKLIINSYSKQENKNLATLIEKLGL